jgi:hypothetical protein
MIETNAPLLSILQYVNDVGRAYGTCSTAAATAAKTVSIVDNPLFYSDGKRGTRILVMFTYTNTAANPTLNVPQMGTKGIRYAGAAITPGMLRANWVGEFMDDGTYWQLLNPYK